jgi:hypothetical protein
MIVALAFETLKVCVVLAPVLGDRTGRVVAEEAQALGPEDPPAHEVEEVVEDHVLFDLERARVSGNLRGDPAAARAEAAPVAVAPFQTCGDQRGGTSATSVSRAT